MALIGANGGLIGTQRSANINTAPGLWTANEQVLLRRAATWPLSSDPNFSSVSLLLHMDGTNGSTTFTDTSSNALTVTPSGNAQISTAQSKFGGASALFDGTGDFLTTASTSGVAFGTGQFTIELWLRLNSLSASYRALVATRPNEGSFSDGFGLGCTAPGEIYMYDSAFRATSPSGTVTTNTWYHIALVRDTGSALRIYSNGNLVATGTATNNYTRTVMTIGANASSSEPLNGYIDDLRITKGIARYTANFTPPTAAFFDA